jgi:folate-binding protein YgfZ
MSSTVSGEPRFAPRVDFGDVKSEFRALVSGCAVYSRGDRAKIAVSGRDRLRWLNGMITNNVRDLAPQHGVYAFLLNPQGHILGDLYAYHCGESLVVDTDQTERGRILEHFDHYIVMDDVEIADIGDRQASVGLAGPKAVEVLRAAGMEGPTLEPLQWADIDWRGLKLTLVRGDHPSVPSFELWLVPGGVSPLWEALGKAGAKPAGSAALELFRVASGIPRYGQDIRERDLPQETEQVRALNFSKGCYIGQEIVERIRSRGNVHRKFSGFVVKGSPPPGGAKVQSDGKDVGELTSMASLPLPDAELVVALGYIRREAGTPGKTFQADGAQVTVAPLPFELVFKD